MKCPRCSHEISDAEIGRYWGRKGGSRTSAAKRAAVRANGKKGGRPPKRKG